MSSFIWSMLGIIGAIFEIPRVIIKYILGLIWVGYVAIIGKNFKIVFSRLNTGMINDIKWVIDEFKYFM